MNQSCVSSGDSELDRMSSEWITSPSLSKFGGSNPQGFQTCPFSVGVCSLSWGSRFWGAENSPSSAPLCYNESCIAQITSEDVRKSDLLAELTDVMSDGVTQDLWMLSIGIDNNPWGLYQPLISTIFGKEYRSLTSSLCNFLHSPVTSSLLGPNTLLHPILKHPQPTFLPQC